MPTRYLKPGIRDSEAIDSLSPLAETLFYRLLVTVDDFGRYDGRPAMVKAHCFPIKEMTLAKCAALLDELHASGLVHIYSVAGKPYLQVRKWDNIPRAKESKYPTPDYDCMHLHTSVNRPRTVVPLTETETETETETGNRKALKGKGSKESAVITRPDCVNEQMWNDWLVIRKKKNAPLTQTAWALMENESAKVGWPIDKAIEECCLRAWASFKADWVSAKQIQTVNKQTQIETENHRVMTEWLAKQGAEIETA